MEETRNACRILEVKAGRPKRRGKNNTRVCFTNMQYVYVAISKETSSQKFFFYELILRPSKYQFSIIHDHA
jgi:hypothetical protein